MKDYAHVIEMNITTYTHCDTIGTMHIAQHIVFRMEAFVWFTMMFML